jgi:hypothetical protein
MKLTTSTYPNGLLGEATSGEPVVFAEKDNFEDNVLLH